jgi:hypothetical protein
MHRRGIGGQEECVASQRQALAVSARLHRKVDITLHGKGNSNSHGARPVYWNRLDDSVDSDQ